MSHLDGVRRRLGVGAAKTVAAKLAKPDAAVPAKNERRETSMMISSRGRLAASRRKQLIHREVFQGGYPGMLTGVRRRVDLGAKDNGNRFGSALDRKILPETLWHQTPDKDE